MTKFAFLILAIIFGIIGFGLGSNPTLDGMGKAMFGVFFSLFCISYLMEVAERADLEKQG